MLRRNVHTFQTLRSLLQSRLSSYSKRLSSILFEKDDNITMIGLDDWRSRNAINSTLSKNLHEAINNFEQDETSPVAVIYGIGGSFSAGYDVIELEKQIENGSLEFIFNKEGAAGPTRRHLRKPIVCGISGFCVGSGLELALLCDLRVMEDTAVLGFYNRKFGVPVTDGGTVRLCKAIGASRALDILSTGRSVSAQEALNIGLINRIVATGTALGQAVNLAFSIAKFSQNAIQHDRNSLYESVYGSKNFNENVQNEILLTSMEVLKELRIGVQKFKQSSTKGAKVDSFNIKEKPVPEWERKEILLEQEYEKKKLQRLDNN